MSYSAIGGSRSAWQLTLEKLSWFSCKNCRGRSIRQILIDVACGLAATFLQFVFTISFAAGCFSSLRTSPLFGFGVVMSALSAICTQMMYSWRSDIPYLFVSPDGFYIPLLNALAVSLSKEIEDDESFQHTFLCAIVITTCTVGFAKFISGTYNLIQFTDYIPYPAICGLMAGIGINLIQVGFRISITKETNQLSFSILVPAMTFAILSIISSKMKINTSTSFLLLLFLSFFSFYIYIFIFQITLIKLYQLNWIYSSNGNLKHLWIYLFNEVLFTSNRSKIKWVAIYNIFDQILSIAVLMVLKISLTIPAYEKALQCRFEKSKELVQYGIGTVIAGLFGAVGTSPSLSVLTLVVEMGGGERVPGIIAPLLLLLVYFTNFQCVSIVPKFVFIGLLLTSGYSMVIAWLINPMYRIPKAEAIIIVIIVGIYLSKGMLFAIGIGAILSVILFIFHFHEISCIKFISSGSVFHSTEERSDLITIKLRKYRHKIVIIQLQGYLTFSNSSQLLDAVIFLLDIDDEENEQGNELSTLNDSFKETKQQQQLQQQHDDNESHNVVANIADTMSMASGIGFNRRLSIRISADDSAVVESSSKAALRSMESFRTKAPGLHLSRKISQRLLSIEGEKRAVRPLSLPVPRSSSSLSFTDQRLSESSGVDDVEAQHFQIYVQSASSSAAASPSPSKARNMFVKTRSIRTPVSDANESLMTVLSNDNDDNDGSIVDENVQARKKDERENNDVDRPFALVLHMNDVVGCDASGMDIFSQIVRICQLKNCQLHLAAVSDKDTILLQKSGLLLNKHVKLSSTLDEALKSTEDMLIEHYRLDNTSSKQCTTKTERHVTNTGFRDCLEVIQKRYPKVEISKLLCLEQYCELMEFCSGQTITSNVGKSSSPSKDSSDLMLQIKVLKDQKSIDDEPSGLFFLACGVIKHLVSIQSDDTCHNPYLFKPTHEKHYPSHSPSHTNTHTQQRMCNLELFPDPNTSSWGSRHGPGWVFEDFDHFNQSIQDRDVNVYCAHTDCKVYHISSESLKKALHEHPDICMVLMQLQLVVMKRQLASAAEQLSNLADVLHFNSARSGHVKQL